MSDSKSTVTADFAVSCDPPLVRKFGVMNSGLVDIDRHRRDLHLLQAIAPDSLRIDLCWGEPRAGWSEEPVQGELETPQYRFSEMDELARQLQSLGVRPYWSYCYMPPPLQQPDWQSVPSNLNVWGKVLGDYARHARNAKLPIGYHEVYNEPDLPGVFFTGTMQDYLDMYAHGARSLREADPDARVGGPALANTQEWSQPFLNFVEQQDLPLDFFSFHVLNPGWSDTTLHHASARLAQLRADFGERPRFHTTEVHINEYHPYEYANTRRGGPSDKFPLAARVLTDIEGLLRETDLTLVHWAQFMSSLPGVADEGMGLVDLDGHRKAAYHAFQIYARMPVDRRTVSAPGGLRAMASADGRRAALVLWNETGRAHEVAITLDHLPILSGTLRVFRIDQDHASFGDTGNEAFEPVETQLQGGRESITWTGTVPDGGVVYLELDDGRVSAGELLQLPGHIDHLRRYYPRRGASSYADFDRRDWTVRLGMGQETQAHEMIGVVASELPPQLHLITHLDGVADTSQGLGRLGVRVDYRDKDGQDLLGVQFIQTLNSSAAREDATLGALPWGTRRTADRIVRVPDLADALLPLAEHAPPGWTGQATLTFVMQNLEPGARAKMTLRKRHP